MEHESVTSDFTDKKLKEVLRVSFANLRSEEQGKSSL